ncbi:hypothetical protein KY290_007752 [Solanum tuberosum]|uniref:RNase H type-1 domain-containing protein n=1 Tax=Solanum tuberosum TaxID=4113 RepID=A0ABQ7W7S1_SOLTU|nr:hypothetical protein KY290_007752 [Solanum tuberosum]
MSSIRIKEQVTWLMSLNLNSQFQCFNFKGNWNDMFIKVEGATLTLDTKSITWKKPHTNMLKLNVDGCCKGNPGEAACGGILRDHNGDMRMSFYSYYGISTNNNAKINSTSKGTWTIRSELEQIINLLEKGHYQVKHFYREANCVTDIWLI